MASDNFNSRRKLLLNALLAGTALGAHSLFGQGWVTENFDSESNLDRDPESDEFDYIVIGSGPGGAPLAANLAEAGYSVLVLEAGPASGNRLNYQVPAFWGKAGDDNEISWDFFVRHYTNIEDHGSQFIPSQGGVLYPRASTLGGCTAHHVMVTLYGENSDWEFIREMTGDDSWLPARMRDHWQSMLRWQSIQQPIPTHTPIDPQLMAIIGAGIADQNNFPPGPQKVSEDPNDLANVNISAQGFFVNPQGTKHGERIGPRERLIGVASRNRNLNIVTNALAEKVLLEKTPGGQHRAFGVQYLKGSHLYEASRNYVPLTEQARHQIRRTVHAKREVIVCGGAYNSPQLLMLSGIGPADHLRANGIPIRIDLPGVGANLQDRVEVFVQNEYENEFPTLLDCEFSPNNDPCLRDWYSFREDSRYGVNGIGVFTKRRYSAGSSRNELVVFGFPLKFAGYVPNFDNIAIERPRNVWSWGILKAYAQGRAGTVRLLSNDPTKRPFINKRSLGDFAGGEYDIAAIKEGIEAARRMSQMAGGNYREIRPGPSADLSDYIRREQFGHHVSCTNPIGADNDPLAVLDSKLRVRGTDNLRVVDASSFPRIPGQFIWASVGMLSEKASLDILQDSDRRIAKSGIAAKSVALAI